jgi:hypothetical protein
MTNALVLTEGETLNLLDSFESVEVPASKLRPGMVIVDDLGCPIAAIDHRLRSTRNSGDVAWFVENLEGSGYRRMAIRPTALVTVAAQ